MPCRTLLQVELGDGQTAFSGFPDCNIKLIQNMNCVIIHKSVSYDSGQEREPGVIGGNE